MRTFEVTLKNSIFKDLFCGSRSNHLRRFLVILLTGLVFLFSFGCGLFYKGVPKPGEFCYVLVKPPECLYVDFEAKKLIWNEVEYNLEEKLRMDYFFYKNEDLYELTVATINRVEIKNVSQSNFNQFYMRKKDKFSEIPKGNSKDETKH